MKNEILYCHVDLNWIEKKVMISKRTVLFISFLFFAVILMTACSVGLEHGSTWRSYAAQGWIKVDTTDVNAEYSGYKRLLNEMAFDKGVGFLVNSKGIPDYLYVPSHNVLYLAYIKLGLIYHFPNISAFGSSPISNQYTSMEDNLPYNIRHEFKKYDSIYSKILNNPEPKEMYIDKSYKKPENHKLTKNEQEVKTVDNYIAIFDFEVRDKDKDISRPLADKVIHVFSESNKYEIIDRSNMNKILGEQKFQMSGCVAQECKVEAGQILGVGKIVNGSVGLVGKTYYLTLQLIDVKTGKVELSAEDECKCEIDELLGSTRRLAKRLLGEKVEEPVAIVQKPATVAIVPPAASAKETARDGRFIAYDNGTVLDTRTNLMWAAKDNGSNINWSNAKSYCDNYRGGGYTDWRMPTQDELAGLYDKAKTYKSDCEYDVHLTELIRLTCTWAWASETRGSAVATFSFTNGKRNWDHQSSDYYYVRALPVRSGK